LVLRFFLKAATLVSEDERMSPATGTQQSPQKSDREILEEIRDNTRTTSVKLFGSSDADKEMDSGRLPKVERSVKNAHERIDRLQTKIVWASGFAAGIGSIIGGAVEFYMQRKPHP
jgi:hypothetical protein